MIDNMHRLLHYVNNPFHTVGTAKLSNVTSRECFNITNFNMASTEIGKLH